jgi:hypothetical protein
MGKLDDAAFLGALAPMAAVPVIGAYKADQIQQKRKKEKEAEDISKEEEIKRKKEPSEGGTNKVTAENKVMKKGGSVSSASKRADGCATKGKTKGRMV